MSKKKSNMPSQFPFDIERLFNPDYFNQLPKWQQEIVNFYTRRLNSYSKIPEQFNECRNPSDVFELQSEFFNKLISDYRNEAAVVSEMLFDMSRPIVEKKQQAAQASYDETILKAEMDAEHIIGLAKNQAETIIEAAEARADSIVNGKKKQNKIA